MKVLFFLHDLVLGGTSVNCVELAAALRDRHGFNVALFSTPGPMLKLVNDNGLRYLPAPIAARCPSVARMRSLRLAVRAERPDLVYVWEGWACFEAFWATHVPLRLPMLVTDMRMELTPILPRRLITTFGTPELAEAARAAGWRNALSLLPPVDTRLNAPGAVDALAFRDRHGLDRHDLNLVTVSRLVDSLKGDGLERLIDAVRVLGGTLPLRLLVVGDGTARPRFERLAQRANAELGRKAVVLTGALADPRPAYAAADVVVGMGSSALRGMAFAKPVIVVGEQGFSAPFNPQTADAFLSKGIYGVGTGGQGATPLREHLRLMCERRDQFEALGAFSRSFVVRHYSLDAIANQLAGLCREAAAVPTAWGDTFADGVRMARIYVQERRFLWRANPPAPMDLVDPLRPEVPLHVTQVVRGDSVA